MSSFLDMYVHVLTYDVADAVLRAYLHNCITKIYVRYLMLR